MAGRRDDSGGRGGAATGREGRRDRGDRKPGGGAIKSLRGVGPTTANVLADEVFFRDRRELAGYFGLVSSPWSSGAVNRDQGLVGSGNPRARRTALELAGLWLRHQPDSALARWFHERAGANGRVRKTMIVAMVRKLMIALWKFLTLGVVPEGAVVKS
jgi:transposase